VFSYGDYKSPTPLPADYKSAGAGVKKQRVRPDNLLKLDLAIKIPDQLP